MSASQQPEVSVVVATRDRERRLAALLESLSRQTIGPDAFEIIVVDDGSSDGTRQLLARYAGAGDIHLRALHLDGPQGPGATRNAGWREARAPLVAFIDDDCVASDGWLAAGAAAANAHPGGFVQGRTESMPAERELLGPFSYTIEVPEAGPQYETCNIFYSRDLLASLGGFDSNAFPGGGEDCDLGWRAIEAGAEPVFAPKALAHHAVHQLGPLGKLRRAAHWTPTIRVFARHPELRRARLFKGVFWHVEHILLLRLLIAIALPKRLNLVRMWLIAPYLVNLRQRAISDGIDDMRAPLLAPYYLVHDAVETAAVVRGAIRYRTFVI